MAKRAGVHGRRIQPDYVLVWELRNKAAIEADLKGEELEEALRAEHAPNLQGP